MTRYRIVVGIQDDICYFFIWFMGQAETNLDNG